MTDLHPGDDVLVRGHVDEQKYIPQSWVAVSSVRANFFAGEEDVFPVAAVRALIEAARGYAALGGVGGSLAEHRWAALIAALDHPAIRRLAEKP